MRIIDKERKAYSGISNRDKKLNEFGVQIEFRGDVLYCNTTNRDSSISILNEQKKWTTLKRFDDFRYGYDNIASNFIVDVAKYLNSFYDTDEFNTLTD